MRLIDADALKIKQQEDADLFINAVSLVEKARRDEALNAVANIVNTPTIIPTCIEAHIKAISAVDVMERKLGHWENDTCSVCGKRWDYLMRANADDWGYFDPMPPYCPNCGANMGEQDDG